MATTETATTATSTNGKFSANAGFDQASFDAWKKGIETKIKAAEIDTMSPTATLGFCIEVIKYVTSPNHPKGTHQYNNKSFEEVLLNYAEQGVAIKKAEQKIISDRMAQKASANADIRVGTAS
tara:strand:- start:151 stop:519 length:369 start_codon:yes stop_codon:yes gene_type:complete